MAKITKINIVVFNETYWLRNSLVFTQNLLPLIKLKELYPALEIKLISFTSIYMILRHHKKLKIFHNETIKNIQVESFPILFLPSNFFIVRWFIYPFLLLSTLPYMIYISIKDLWEKSNSVYFLRAYNSGCIFTQLYFGKSKLVFDPRTDFIVESRKINLWNQNSLSDKLWICLEKKILNRCNKTIFISDIFQEEVLARHSLSSTNKYYIIYNCVNTLDFRSSINKPLNFLYTGSLGNWNNIKNYLDFFYEIQSYYPNSFLYILTSTQESKYKKIIKDKKYSFLLERIIIKRNVEYSLLPSYYNLCSFGLQLMDIPDSRVGVKFVEYVAADIIPIVNQNVKGAAFLCNKYDIGVDISNYSDFESIHRALENKRKDPYRQTKFETLKKEIDILNITKKIKQICEE